ncbi:hypothetical protein EDC01DRAFT_750227 [Geopyxis carbonaria]|nr:hypothetical protein EDC01DRAFT_750227 [Geopyxis carbonaria]
MASKSSESSNSSESSLDWVTVTDFKLKLSPPGSDRDDHCTENAARPNTDTGATATRTSSRTSTGNTCSRYTPAPSGDTAQCTAVSTRSQRSYSRSGTVTPTATDTRPWAAVPSSRHAHSRNTPATTTFTLSCATAPSPAPTSADTTLCESAVSSSGRQHSHGQGTSFRSHRQDPGPICASRTQPQPCWSQPQVRKGMCDCAVCKQELEDAHYRGVDPGWGGRGCDHCGHEVRCGRCTCVECEFEDQEKMLRELEWEKRARKKERRGVRPSAKKGTKNLTAPARVAKKAKTGAAVRRSKQGNCTTATARVTRKRLRI